MFRTKLLSAAIKVALVSLIILGKPSVTNAQNRNFKLTQSLEIQYSILRTLATEYVDTVNFAKIINRGIDAMLETVDPYTEYVPEEDQDAIEMITTASYGGIGATIRKDSLGVMIVQTYENSPAIRFNLEPGDIIMKIDNVDISQLSVEECSKRMRGNPSTKVKFTVKKGRTGQIEEKFITRDRVHTSDVPYYGLLKFPQGSKLMQDSSIAYSGDVPVGYIKYSSFTLNGSEDVRKALINLKQQGAKRIVLDLRGNSGGLMDEATDIVSLFVPKGTLVVSARGRGEDSNFTCVTDKNPVDTLIPLLVLTNSSSASSSEIVAGALQDLDRAAVMGSRTFGKGLVQSFRPVSYGGKLKLTIAKYYTPSGRCIQIMDYSHRNPDGSVGSIPDSLKKAFKTKKGRTVYDGGGIAPDVEVSGYAYSRPALALSLNGILEEYAIEFYKNNPNVAEFVRSETTLLNATQADIEKSASFRMTDAQYKEFVDYAALRNFDHRTVAEVIFDQMVRGAKSEGLYEKDKEVYQQLSDKVKLSKQEVLYLYRNEIQPLLEEEIIQKYSLTAPRVRHLLDYDIQLWRALCAWE